MGRGATHVAQRLGIPCNGSPESTSHSTGSNSAPHRIDGLVAVANLVPAVGSDGGSGPNTGT